MLFALAISEMVSHNCSSSVSPNVIASSSDKAYRVCLCMFTRDSKCEFVLFRAAFWIWIVWTSDCFTITSFP